MQSHSTSITPEPTPRAFIFFPIFLFLPSISRYLVYRYLGIFDVLRASTMSCAREFRERSSLLLLWTRGIGGLAARTLVPLGFFFPRPVRRILAAPPGTRPMRVYLFAGSGLLPAVLFLALSISADIIRFRISVAVWIFRKF